MRRITAANEGMRLAGRELNIWSSARVATAATYPRIVMVRLLIAGSPSSRTSRIPTRAKEQALDPNTRKADYP